MSADVIVVMEKVKSVNNDKGNEMFSLNEIRVLLKKKTISHFNVIEDAH